MRAAQFASRSSRKRTSPSAAIHFGMFCASISTANQHTHALMTLSQFSYKCISTSLERNSRCPKCNFAVEQIFPNFLRKLLAIDRLCTRFDRLQCVCCFLRRHLAIWKIEIGTDARNVIKLKCISFYLYPLLVLSLSLTRS